MGRDYEKKSLGIVKFQGYELELQFLPSAYVESAQNAVEVIIINGDPSVSEDDWFPGEQYCMLSVNLVNRFQEENEFFVKCWNENYALVEHLKTCDGIKMVNTGKLVPTGHVQAEVWRALI